MGNNLLIVQYHISKHANHISSTPGQVSQQTQPLGQSQFQLDPVALNIKKGMGANVFV